MYNPTSFPARIVPIAKRMLLLAGIWIVLVEGEQGGIIVGAIIVPVSVWLSLWLLPAGLPLRLGALARLLPGFIWRSVVGGVDVAWRAFHPRLPVDPGWIELPVTLPAGGRVALGAELSLMPGTLVAGSEDEKILIHVLNRTQDMTAQVRAEEARLAQTLPTGGDL